MSEALPGEGARKVSFFAGWRAGAGLVAALAVVLSASSLLVQCARQERPVFEMKPADSIRHPGAEVKRAPQAGSGTLAGDGVAGPTMSLDPFFKYYEAHPWPETAERLRALGFTNALVVFTREIPPDHHRTMLEALHGAGLTVTLRLNPPTDFEAWEQHPDWRQRMLDGTPGRHDWRVYCCPNNPAFMDYYAGRVAGLMRDYPYDALLLSEMWFEVWGGAWRNNPVRGRYACLCDHCVAAFRDRSGADARELFNESSPLYFERPGNNALYRKWVDFRVGSVNAMGRRLAEAARAARPGLKIGYMFLADQTVEPGRTREYQAQDLEAAIRATGAEFVVIQDAWQDWTKPRLSPRFVHTYADAYLGRIRAVNPAVPVLVHADIGSLPAMKRSKRWMSRTASEARRAGFSGVVFYEFTLNLDRY
ncbi:MAG: hypothetical protein Kow0059_11980 [Candidatus Sumerlaeia bacterium]